MKFQCCICGKFVPSVITSVSIPPGEIIFEKTPLCGSCHSEISKTISKYKAALNKTNPGAPAAIKEVTDTQFEVMAVIFQPDGRWLYFDISNAVVAFTNPINQSVLEAAVNSLESFPAAFFVADFYN